jgi:hypothetical protein
MAAAAARVARMQRLLPGVWAGLLIAVATVATAAAFAVLERADAGRVAARVLATEAYASLALAALLMALARVEARMAADDPGAGERPMRTPLGAAMLLPAGALFCTIVGYFALQPLLEAARAGSGAFSFGQLHAFSVACYAVKLVLVVAMAWRASAAPGVGR